MRKRSALLAVAAFLAALIFIGNVQAQPLVNIETVTVGDPGNAADITGYGAVSNVFAIGKYEVTIGQYASFLNSVASLNTNSYIVNLWNPSMSSDSSVGVTITRSGALGAYSYAAAANTTRPAVFVSWFDAARFANWLNNGATNGADTETGAYTLNGSTTGVNFTKNAGATWWIPSENEWFKAAYFKGGGTNAGYWRYPTQSDTAPTSQVPPGLGNSANFNGVQPNGLSPVGSYIDSISAYGTFDQGGNVWEWNDAIAGSERGSRGGSWFGSSAELQADFRGSDPPSGEYSNEGFRVATVPEPSSYALLLMTGAGALWWVRRRR